MADNGSHPEVLNKASDTEPRQPEGGMLLLLPGVDLMRFTFAKKPLLGAVISKNAIRKGWCNSCDEEAALQSCCRRCYQCCDC